MLVYLKRHFKEKIPKALASEDTCVHNLDNYEKEAGRPQLFWAKERQLNVDLESSASRSLQPFL